MKFPIVCILTIRIMLIVMTFQFSHITSSSFFKYSLWKSREVSIGSIHLKIGQELCVLEIPTIFFSSLSWCEGIVFSFVEYFLLNFIFCIRKIKIFIKKISKLSENRNWISFCNIAIFRWNISIQSCTDVVGLF